MDLQHEIGGHIELHSTEGIADCFARGLKPDAICNGNSLLEELIGEYTRGPRFKDCVQVLIDNGVTAEDLALKAVLLNDAQGLEIFVKEDMALLHKLYTYKCAYTPLFQVTLLHFCAEFNHVDAARVLLKYGANVDAAAGLDHPGFGGQSPVFHTVNQNGNHSADMLGLLLEHGANLRLTVPGLIWGKGYPWETFIPAVNPLSYAMMGLLPQMHRNEKQVSETVTLLLAHAYGIHYTPGNVPNAYLEKG